MRYALLLYADVERARRTTPDEAAAELAVYAAITEELESAGVLVGGEAFMPRRRRAAGRAAGGAAACLIGGSADEGAERVLLGGLR